jgi:hypothetical protein
MVFKLFCCRLSWIRCDLQGLNVTFLANDLAFASRILQQIVINTIQCTIRQPDFPNTVRIM